VSSDGRTVAPAPWATARVRLVLRLAMVVGVALGVETIVLHVLTDPLADIHAYYDAGARLNAGQPLYDQPAGVDEAAFYRYPPLLAIAFRPLALLPFPVAAAVLAVMVLAVVTAWTRMQQELDPTVVVGPVSVAVLAVVAYRALEREAAVRQRLLDDLREAQGDLADAQHRAGMIAERARLSREIHDSVAQGLSSINLLLQAAEQDWDSRPDAARAHAAQAARTARDSLDEVRRVVRDLAPADLEAHDTALPQALERAARSAVGPGGPEVLVQVHGDPLPVPRAVATALLRTTRGALANVVEHAAAEHATVTLTYQGDSVSLDVRDDGRGFDPVPERRSGSRVRGHGLAGIRARVCELGGELVVESAPGEGTALAVSLPVAGTTARQDRMAP